MANSALAAGAGVLWFLACADFDAWPLAWIAMVPTLVAVERSASVRGAFFYAWLTGLVGNLGGFYWIAGTLTRFTSAPAPAALGALFLLAAYQGLVFGGVGATVWWIRQRAALPMALIAPLAMVTFELAMPMLFPFNVSITQAWQAHVIQIADLTGPLGVTALLLMVNGAVYDAAVRRQIRTVPAMASLAIVIAAIGYGHFRIRQVDARRAAAPVLDVGVVQPNVAFDTKGIDYPTAAATQLHDLHVQSRALEAEGAQLIVWPESAYPYLIRQRLPQDTGAHTAAIVRRGFSVPLIFGAIAERGVPVSGRPPRYNSLFLLDRRGALARYDKMFLVPFSEYLPGRELISGFQGWLPQGAGGLSPGSDVVALSMRSPDGAEYRIGPMICFEDTLPRFGRKLAALRPAGRIRGRSHVVDPSVSPRGPDRFTYRVALLEGGGTVYATSSRS